MYRVPSGAVRFNWNGLKPSEETERPPEIADWLRDADSGKLRDDYLAKKALRNE